MESFSKSIPIKIAVNYWDIKSDIGSDQNNAFWNNVKRHEIGELTTFVPWQVFDSDIYRKLQRFIQAAVEHQVNVSLVLTPELAVHYPYSGVPKDLMISSENDAKDSSGENFFACFPPKGFYLPSLLSPEISKRYFSYLVRFNSFLSQLDRMIGRGLSNIELVLTGSFWKYYRSGDDLGLDPFSGICGDFSRFGVDSFRKCVDHYYASKEFEDPTPMDSHQWKTRQFDEMNLRWFFQQSEEIFRLRSEQLLSRVPTHADLVQYEIFTPEVDPSMKYDSFLQVIAGGQGDLNRLSDLIEQYSYRSTSIGKGLIPSFIHWTSLGQFRQLEPKKKERLIEKSIYSMVPHGGGVILDWDEWVSLSPQFKEKCQQVSRFLKARSSSRVESVTYLAPHLWSSCGHLWNSVKRNEAQNYRMIGSIDSLKYLTHSKALFVDPNYIITQGRLEKFLEWMAEGRLLVLAQDGLYTRSARKLLDSIAHRVSKDSMNLQIGLSYQIFDTKGGRLILFDQGMDAEKVSQVQIENIEKDYDLFVSSVLRLLEENKFYQISDIRIESIVLENEKDRSSSHRHFNVNLWNSSSKPIQGAIQFEGEVHCFSHMDEKGKTSALSEGGGSENEIPFHLEGYQSKDFLVVKKDQRKEEKVFVRKFRSKEVDQNQSWPEFR